MLDRHYIGRTPHIYRNKLKWVESLSGLSLNGSGVRSSGFSQEPFEDYPGMFFSFKDNQHFFSNKQQKYQNYNTVYIISCTVGVVYI